MIKGFLDRLFAVYAASPLIFIIAIWWFGGSVLASILHFGTDYRTLLWSIVIISCALLTIALLHEAGLADRAWPQSLMPKLRAPVMDALDKYTTKDRLERLIAAKTQSERFNAEACAEALKKGIIGQDKVCDEVARVLRRRLAQINRTKPVGVFLFAGPPGVGKTEFAKVLSEYLGGGFIFEDMAQCGSPEKINTLLGSPKGYMGADTYGTLTGGLKSAPRSLILLDEIEKAHKSIQGRFLTAWNDGFIAEASDNKKVPTTGAIFIMTTNAAHEAISEAAKSAEDADSLKVATTHILKEEGFTAEVLSRIDNVFVFECLEGMDIVRLTMMQIASLAEKYGLQVAEGDLSIDDKIMVEAVVRSTKLQQAGGVRAVMKLLEDKLGDKMIDAKDSGAKVVRIVMHGKTLDDIELERA